MVWPSGRPNIWILIIRCNMEEPWVKLSITQLVENLCKLTAEMPQRTAECAQGSFMFVSGEWKW